MAQINPLRDAIEDDDSPEEVPTGPQAEEELWDADPNCRHKILSAPGGGIRCAYCPGWFCY